MDLEETVRCGNNLPAIIEDKVDKMPDDPDHGGFLFPSLFLSAIASAAVIYLTPNWNKSLFPTFLTVPPLIPFFAYSLQAEVYDWGRNYTNRLYERSVEALPEQ